MGRFLFALISRTSKVVINLSKLVAWFLLAECLILLETAIDPPLPFWLKSSNVDSPTSCDCSALMLILGSYTGATHGSDHRCSLITLSVSGATLADIISNKVLFERTGQVLCICV